MKGQLEVDPGLGDSELGLGDQVKELGMESEWVSGLELVELEVEAEELVEVEVEGVLESLRSRVKSKRTHS